MRRGADASIGGHLDLDLIVRSAERRAGDGAARVDAPKFVPDEGHDRRRVGRVGDHDPRADDVRQRRSDRGEGAFDIGDAPPRLLDRIGRYLTGLVVPPGGIRYEDPVVDGNDARVALLLLEDASGLDLNKRLMDFAMTQKKGALHSIVLEALNYEAKKIMK